MHVLFLQFPTVTICNNNMLARGYLKAMEDYLGSNALSEIFRDLFAQYADLPPPVEK